jgi:hypothetical protein
MVIVIPNSKKQVDFVSLTSINYGLARVGGPVVAFKPGVILNLKDQEKICISGHGGIGSIEYVPAQTYANVLADPIHGCKTTLKQLIFTCCYAGLRNKEMTGTSVIEIFAETLQIPDLLIRGALGPSIKSNVLGEHYRVIKDNSDAFYDSWFGNTSQQIQSSELEKTKDDKLMDPKTKWNKKMDLDTLMAKGQKDNKPYIEYKAQKYSDRSKDFFVSFVAELEKKGKLLDTQASMATAMWDGAQVTYEKPQESSDKCYITTATVRSLGLPDDCATLTTLRHFRDEVLLKSPSGRSEVAAYYATAPAIVSVIDRLADARAIYRRIYEEFLAPAVRAVQELRFSDAYASYRRLVHETRERFLS